MKRKDDPRHLKRVKLMQSLFEWDFNHKVKLDKGASEIVATVDKIDELVAKAAPSRPLSQINKIDLAILRISIFELIMKKDVPPKVVIDEAVELAKEYGGDSSPALVNGALGRIMEDGCK